MFAGVARAAVRFVDGACPTSGTGSALACGASGPFRTINEGIDAMAPGDTLNVRGAHDGFDGVYFEQVSLRDDAGEPGQALACTPGQRCVIQGCRAPACPTNEQPIVRGMTLRTDWTDLGGGVFRRGMEATPLADGQERDGFDPHMLLQGPGTPLTMLAYAGDSVPTPGDGEWSYHPASREVVVNPVGSAPAAGQVYVPHFSFNVFMEAPTENVTFQYFTLEGTRGPSFEAHGHQAAPVNGLEIRGLVQRYATRHFILANPAPDLLVEDNLAEYGCRGISWALTSGDGCFGYRVFGAHDAIFRRNTLRHLGAGGRRKLSGGETGWVCPWCDPPWNDPAHTDVSTFGTAFNIKQTEGAVLEDNQIEDVLLSGIALDVSRGVTVQRNTIRRSRNAISMLDFTPTGGCPTTGTSQFCYNSDHVIRNNVIDEAGLDNALSCALDLTGGSERHAGATMLVEVYNNVISRPSFAGICLKSETGTPSTDVVIAHNTVYGTRNIGAGEPSRGILVRDATANVVVRNNLVDGLGADGIVLSNAARSGLSLDGDVIGAVDGCQVRWNVPDFEFFPIGGTCDSLQEFAGANPPNEVNGRTGPAAFAAPNANPPNLHLLPSSAAIEAGVPVAILDDIDGDPRPLGSRWDAGADEFTGTVTSTTSPPTTTTPSTTTPTTTSPSTTTPSTTTPSTTTPSTTTPTTTTPTTTRPSTTTPSTTTPTTSSSSTSTPSTSTPTTTRPSTTTPSTTTPSTTAPSTTTPSTTTPTTTRPSTTTPSTTTPSTTTPTSSSTSTSTSSTAPGPTSTIPTTTSTTTADTTTTTTISPAMVQKLSGQSLILRDKLGSPWSRRLRLLSVDKTLLTLGTPVDIPALIEQGGTLHVRAVGGDGFDASYALEPAAWRLLDRRRPAKGVLYVNPAGPITKIRFEVGKRLLILGKGVLLRQSLGLVPEAIDVELTIGSRLYCLSFGGSRQLFEPRRKLLRSSAGRPSECQNGTAL